VSRRLFNELIVPCIFSKPREPHGGMKFYDQSINHTDHS
jgi:hypothetical protein